MARPPKSGLDYFPHDVNLDDNVELLEAEHGLIGYAILMKLYEKIYSDGYYIQWKEENQLLFSRRVNAELTIVNGVINTCFKRNLFNKKLYDAYGILTSRGIQKRYFSACKTARRQRVNITDEYLLIDKNELMHDFTELMQEETPVNSYKSTQRKGKERKEKVKEIESKEDEGRIRVQKLTMTQEEYQKLVEKYGQKIVDDKIEYAKNYAPLMKKYKNLYLTLNNWLKSDAGGKSNGSGKDDQQDNKYQGIGIRLSDLR